MDTLETILSKLHSHCDGTFVLTGQPGTGKSTLLSKILDNFTQTGTKFAGIIGKEHRNEEGARDAFMLGIVRSSNNGWYEEHGAFATKTAGKWTCNDAELIAILPFLRKCLAETKPGEYFILDEIGDIQLSCKEFVEFLDELNEFPNVAKILTVSMRSENPICKKFLTKAEKDGKIFETTYGA